MSEPLTFGSLFAGIGGIDLGFERAGMKCKWQVEIDDYASRVLARHWPDVRRWRDIKTFCSDSNRWGCEKCKERNSESQSGIKPSCGCDIDGLRVDVIAGGFPCQDISYAGKGAGLAGERSGLFYEAIRVIRTL